MRVPVQELAILAGARLRLVGVDDEVRGLGVLRDEAPLHARRKARAAAAAQVRLLDLVDDGGRRHRERLLVGAVHAAARGLVDVVGAFDADEASDQLRHVLERRRHQWLPPECLWSGGIFLISSSAAIAVSGVRRRKYFSPAM